MTEELEQVRRMALQTEGQAQAYLKELNELRKKITQGKKEDTSPNTEDKQTRGTTDKNRESPRKIARRTAENRIQKSRDTSTDSEIGRNGTLEPPEKWPQVQRPAIGGKRKILKDDPETQKAIYEEYLIEKGRTDSHQRRTEKNKENASSTPKSKTQLSLAETIEEIVEKILDKRIGKITNNKKDNKGEANKSNTGKPRITSITEPEVNFEIRQIKERDEITKEEKWTRVLGRREKKNNIDKKNSEKLNQTRRNRSQRQVDRKTPRTAAIQISCREGAQYAEVLREAKEKINLEQIGISEIRPRRARTGALLLEIPGKEGNVKANQLADKMKEITRHNNNVLITRPEKMAEIRVRDLVDSTTKAEIIGRFAELGGCDINSIKAGEIARSFNGLDSLIVRCPLMAAKTITKSVRVKVGWISLSVDLLPERPAQCFRCFETGHVRAQCRSEVDRGSQCYRCGEVGHIAKGCNNPVKCVVCDSKGRNAEHRMGGPACKMKGEKSSVARIGGFFGNSRITSTPKKMEIDEITQGSGNSYETQERSTRGNSMAKQMARCSIDSEQGKDETTIPCPMDMDEDTIPMEWPADGETWTEQAKDQRKDQHTKEND